jgi:SAM-dependent methyltransferase
MIEVKFHNKKYSQELDLSPSNLLGNPRLRVLKSFTETTGLKFSGNILDAGCGNGYAGISLALLPAVNNVVCLDSSDIAVYDLIPRNSKYYGVDKKIDAILGSFNNISFSEEFDYIIAFGALHHSPCLFSTFKSLTKSLKVGGFIIAHEPVMPNITTHKYFVEKYEKIEERYGLRFRHGERFDRFYRDAEYICAGILSGLDLVYSGQLELSKKSQKSNNPISKAFFFKKDKIDYVPHLWAHLK